MAWLHHLDLSLSPAKAPRLTYARASKGGQRRPGRIAATGGRQCERACMQPTGPCTGDRCTQLLFFHRDVWHSGVWQVCLSLAVSVEIGKAGRIGRHLRGTGSMARGQAVQRCATGVTACQCQAIPCYCLHCPARALHWVSGTMYSSRQFLLSDGCLIRYVPACSLKVENADIV